MNGRERAWVEMLAERRDMSMSALFRAWLKEAYDALLVADTERTGLDEDELTVIELLAENPAPQDRKILELRCKMKNPFSAREPVFRKPLGRLRYMGYLRKEGQAYTLSARGVAAAELRSGWLSADPRGPCARPVVVP
jgi:hypothetical protein